MSVLKEMRNTILHFFSGFSRVKTKRTEHVGMVRRVVDGDTVDLLVELDFDVLVKIRGRLTDVNTPERGDPEFDEATMLLTKLLDEAEDENGFIHFVCYGKDKYGRWLVDIDGVNEVLAKRWPYV